MSIYSIHIRNFKSIRDSGPIRINPLNILIGSNGAGKSNFIGFFKFLNMLFEQQLQNHISRKGRADGFMYFGRRSKFIGGEIIFTNEDNRISNRYSFKMEPDQSNSLFFSEEYSDYNMKTKTSNDEISWSLKKINSGGPSESRLQDDGSVRSQFLRDFFKSFKVFHFHDTSDSSKLKGFCNTTDYEYLIEDGSNLPAFLYKMKELAPKNFKILEFTVKSIAPFIDSLYLQPDQLNPNQIELRWKEKGYDNLFNAYSLSDGTLRFICLCTLLLQPDPPNTIIIDEPELGLHPAAIIKLGAMIQSASVHSQIIVSTQSINLLDNFKPEDIIVVDRENDQTIFKRLSKSTLGEWLDNYTLGELWKKNVLGGRP
ncbi:AAA family ATPase [Mucilaginibacter mali]|uniref:AAA family ATPase n=1 Tax=Mucilaginibacter mali TaxID=2740462 RepID=A0A7D4QBD6_9SPHI|nr:AAA family ATPase [Mucilaginibacter mali]QKJ31565.1 AAA family ATPase [Mucilaginibacter mali]